MKAKFMCAGKQMMGEVIKANFYTVWVKVKFKKKITETIEDKIKEIIKPRIIKRHKEKHAVLFIGE